LAALAAAAAMLQGSGQAQASRTVNGQWTGNFKMQGGDVPIVVDVTKNQKGEWLGTLGIPDIGVTGIRLEKTWSDRRMSALNVSAPQAVFSVVAPGTVAALGIPLKAGRDFTNEDIYDAPFTALINESLARKSSPGQDPLGRVILCGLDSMKGMKIVGVVGDIRQGGPAGAPRAEIFMPYEQHPKPTASMSVVVRTASDPAALAQKVRLRARQISPDVPVKFTTLEVSLWENVAAPRLRTLLFGIFAGLAVALAMAGIYGVMAFVVGQRANEIGLRMALGASPFTVMAMVMRQGLALAAIGLAIGLAGAVAATRLLTQLLFEVKPGDPLTYAGVSVLLAFVALAASYFPARRATKVDPLSALRQE
jgi:putative ABC transport system permease protein